MNKLITTNNGGYPFVLDDLRFVDESVRNSFKAIMRPLGGTTLYDGFIMSMAFDENTVYQMGSLISDTFVFMNGEIWELPAFNLPTSIADPFIKVWIVPDISYTNTTPGQKVLQNGTTVQSYEIRRAKHVFSDLMPAGYPGGFIALYYSNPQNGWKIMSNGHLKGLQNQKSGLNTAIQNIATNTANIATNTTNISGHETRLDIIDTPWILSSEPLKNVVNFLFNNGTMNDANAYQSPIGQHDSASFIKYKIIGKTLFLNISITNFIIPAHSSGQVNNIVLDFYSMLQPLGLDFSPQISGILHISERNMESPPSNIAYITKHTPGSYCLRLTQLNFSEESGTAWNYNYYFPVGTPQGFTQAYRKGSGAPATQNPKYSFRGSLVLELV